MFHLFKRYAQSQGTGPGPEKTGQQQHGHQYRHLRTILQSAELGLNGTRTKDKSRNIQRQHQQGQQDLAAAHPAKLKELADAWMAWAQRCGVDLGSR